MTHALRWDHFCNSNAAWTTRLAAQTGDGQILCNLLYNIANLLNPDESLTLLSLLSQISQLTVI